MKTILMFTKHRHSDEYVCYYEDSGTDQVIGTFYLKEWKFKELGEPDKLRVSIEKVEE